MRPDQLDPELWSTVADRLTVLQAYHKVQADLSGTEAELARLEATIVETQFAITHLKAELEAYYGRPFDGDLPLLSVADGEAARLETMVRLCSDGIGMRDVLRERLAEIKAQSSALFAPFSGAINGV